MAQVPQNMRQHLRTARQLQLLQQRAQQRDLDPAAQQGAVLDTFAEDVVPRLSGNQDVGDLDMRPHPSERLPGGRGTSRRSMDASSASASQQAWAAASHHDAQPLSPRASTTPRTSTNLPSEPLPSGRLLFQQHSAAAAGTQQPPDGNLAAAPGDAGAAPGQEGDGGGALRLSLDSYDLDLQLGVRTASRWQPPPGAGLEPVPEVDSEVGWSLTLGAVRRTLRRVKRERERERVTFGRALLATAWGALQADHLDLDITFGDDSPRCVPPLPDPADASVAADARLPSQPSRPSTLQPSTSANLRAPGPSSNDSNSVAQPSFSIAGGFVVQLQDAADDGAAGSSQGTTGRAVGAVPVSAPSVAQGDGAGLAFFKGLAELPGSQPPLQRVPSVGIPAAHPPGPGILRESLMDRSFSLSKRVTAVLDAIERKR